MSISLTTRLSALSLFAAALAIPSVANAQLPDPGMTIDPDGETFWYLGEYAKNIGGSTASRILPGTVD